MDHSMPGEGWVLAIDRANLAADSGCAANVMGQAIALFECDGAIYAIDNWCTHGHARLSDGFFDGEMVECPLHQGLFDVRTGRAMGSPATVNLRTHEVRVVDGQVFVRLSLPPGG